MSEHLMNGSEITSVVAEEHFAALPAPWAEGEIGARTRRRIAASRQKVVVIDDDPTGCQTVHDVPMLLEWTADALCEGLTDQSPALFVLSNSRAVDQTTAAQMNREIAENLRDAARLCGASYVVVSRSDSTLRGHYPHETDALSDVLGPYDGVIIAPCFFEGGRYTAQGIHWVRQGDRLLPAAQTESAADPTFGFSHSYLTAWVEEKTGSRVTADAVLVIGIDDIRQGGPARVAELLTGVRNGGPVVIDAVKYGDLDLFVAGLLDAEEAGKRFLYRTAASFVRARAGIVERPLLTRDELLGDRARTPGLVAVGSFVPRSTAQLGELLAMDPDASVELNVRELLRPGGPRHIVARIADQMCQIYDTERTPVVYTSRDLERGSGPAASLHIMNLVSDALVEVVRTAVSQRDFGFVVAKGGITSHELACKALDARRTRVLGQIAAGVPVWRLGAESLCPGMPYVVFPGNVGDAGTLEEVMVRLQSGM